MGAPLLIRSARLRLGSPSFGRGRPRAAAGDPGSAVGPFDLGRSRAQNLGWGRSDCYHRPVARSRVRIWLIIFFVPILLMLGGIGYLAWRQSVAAVRVEFSPVPKFIGMRTPITLDLHARRGGVQSVDVRLLQGGTRVNVAQQTFSGTQSNEQRVQLIVAGGTLGLREGADTLEVRARDGFWRPIRVDDRT